MSSYLESIQTYSPNWCLRAAATVAIVTAIALGTILAPVSSGTTGKIKGYVRDATTGEPIPGANVYIREIRRGATTDHEGFYVILLVGPGVHKMHASLIGFEGQSKSGVLVQSDFTTDIDFELKETMLMLDGAIVVTAERPPVEPDRTTSKYIVGASEIEAVPLVRSSQ